MDLKYESNNEEELLWFPSNVFTFELVEASNHPLQREYSVTGVTRIKKNKHKLGKQVWVNEKKLAMFRFQDQVYAIDDTCPHMGAPLHAGDIEEIDGHVCVACPNHHWPFQLSTGRCLIPNSTPLQSYPTAINSKQMILIGFPAIASKLFSNSEF